MNISAINMIQNTQNFRCAKCDKKADETPQTAQDMVDTQNAPVIFANMGPNYFYPISVSQVKQHEDNLANALAEYDRVNVLDANTDEPLEEYLERHKLEWSM